MYKMGLEAAEEPDIKSATFIGSWRKQRISRKTPASMTTLKLLIIWITTNWKILKEMGVPDHLTCLLNILHAVQEAMVGIGHGKMDWFKNGKRE